MSQKNKYNWDLDDLLNNKNVDYLFENWVNKQKEIYHKLYYYSKKFFSLNIQSKIKFH